MSLAFSKVRLTMPVARFTINTALFESAYAASYFDFKIQSRGLSIEMKLLVFAHTPPPHHGQSYMVQLMLDGFGGDWRKKRRAPASKPSRTGPVNGSGSTSGIECYHINARLSRKLEDIGNMRLGKFVLLLGYCLQAIWCRFRHGVRNFYYVPA